MAEEKCAEKGCNGVPKHKCYCRRQLWCDACFDKDRKLCPDCSYEAYKNTYGGM